MSVVTFTAITLGAIQREYELDEMLRILERDEISAVVEIGVHTGGTLWAWGQCARPDAVLIGIDIYLGNVNPAASGDARVRLIKGDSRAESTITQVERELGGRPVDLLFIDGDHTYETVKTEFEMYSPLVRSGGVIAFHDILIPEIARYWDEISHGDLRSDELVGTDMSKCGGLGGIGVLFQLKETS